MIGKILMGAAGVLIVAGTAGCAAASADSLALGPAPTSADGASAGTTSTGTTVAGVTRGVVPFEEYDGGMDARWSGRLEVRGGCVVLVDGWHVQLPVFPADAVLDLDAAGGSVRIGDQLTLPLGAPLSGGGGYVPEFDGTVAPECADLDVTEYLIIHTFEG